MPNEFDCIKYCQERAKELYTIFEKNDIDGFILKNINFKNNLNSHDRMVLFSEIERSFSGPWIFPWNIEENSTIIFNEISLFYICAYYHLHLENNTNEAAQEIINKQKDSLFLRAVAFFKLKALSQDIDCTLMFEKLLRAIKLHQKKLRNINTSLENFREKLIEVNKNIIKKVKFNSNLSYFADIEPLLPKFFKPKDCEILICQLILLAEEALIKCALDKEFSKKCLPGSMSYLSYERLLASYCVVAYLSSNQKPWANSKIAREVIFSHFEFLLLNRNLKLDGVIDKKRFFSKTFIKQKTKHSKLKYNVKKWSAFFDVKKELYVGLNIIKEDLHRRIYFSNNKNLLSVFSNNGTICAERIKKYMKGSVQFYGKKKISQKQLGNMVGHSQGAISKMLNNKSIEVDNILTLTAKTGLTDLYLLGLSDDPTKSSNGLRPLIIKFPKNTDKK